MQSLVVPVQGMSCGGCTGSVKRAVERLPGVKSATATLAPAEVVVELADDRTGLAELVSAILGAGYEVPADWRSERGLA